MEKESELKWKLVLIETLWNVKMRYMDLLVPAVVVLIETLWNVKISSLNTFDGE